MLDALQAGREYSPSILFVVSRQGTRGIILVRLLCPVAVRPDGFFSGENQVAEACVWIWLMKAATPLVGCWDRRHFPTLGPQFLWNTGPWFAHRPDDVRQPLVAEFLRQPSASRVRACHWPVAGLLLACCWPATGQAARLGQACFSSRLCSLCSLCASALLQPLQVASSARSASSARPARLPRPAQPTSLFASL